jgi:membrane protein implicated in regulation of membrane protease activity
VDATFWAVMGLLLILAEFIVPQFVIFFFGAGALINALLVALVPGLASRLPLQLVLWAFTSGISLALLRKYASRWFRGDTRAVENDADRDAGLTATVSARITGAEPGRITLHGTSWRAVAYDETIEAGSVVTILRKENLTYVVTAGDLLGDNGGTDPKE